MRTSAKSLRELLQLPNTEKVNIFIEVAEQMVDRIETCDSANSLNAQTLEKIELLLAAHVYALSPDGRQYKSRSELTASASFDGQTAMNLDATMWGQLAKSMDHSGCLSTVGKRQPKFAWLGKPL